MSQPKIEFIRSLQEEVLPLWPSDISQKIRVKFSWICLYRADPDLDSTILRGYMVRQYSARAHTPDDPASFWCVVAGNQDMGWQNLVWTKEMLQALDSEEALTSDSEKLGKVIDMKGVHEPNGHDTPAHIVADKNGFTLALGCAIPKGYRDLLRKEISENGKIDPLHRANMESYIPAEYIDFVVDLEFETKFQTALSEINESKSLTEK
jgi:hypothetical protein